MAEDRSRTTGAPATDSNARVFVIRSDERPTATTAIKISQAVGDRLAGITGMATERRSPSISTRSFLFAGGINVHARPGFGSQSGFANGLARNLADAIRAILDPSERRIDFLDAFSL